MLKKSGGADRRGGDCVSDPEETGLFAGRAEHRSPRSGPADAGSFGRKRSPAASDEPIVHSMSGLACQPQPRSHRPTARSRRGTSRPHRTSRSSDSMLELARQPQPRERPPTAGSRPGTSRPPRTSRSSIACSACSPVAATRARPSAGVSAGTSRRTRTSRSAACSVRSRARRSPAGRGRGARAALVPFRRFRRCRQEAFRFERQAVDRAQHDRRARGPRGARVAAPFRSSARSSFRCRAPRCSSSFSSSFRRGALRSRRATSSRARGGDDAAERRHRRSPSSSATPRARRGPTRSARRSPTPTAARAAATGPAQGRHAVRPPRRPASRVSRPGPRAPRVPGAQEQRAGARRRGAAAARGRAAGRRDRETRRRAARPPSFRPTCGPQLSNGPREVGEARRPRRGDPGGRARDRGRSKAEPRMANPGRRLRRRRGRSRSTRAGTTGAPYAAEMIRRIKLHWDVPELAAPRLEGQRHGSRFSIMADGTRGGRRRSSATSGDSSLRQRGAPGDPEVRRRSGRCRTTSHDGPRGRDRNFLYNLRPERGRAHGAEPR